MRSRLLLVWAVALVLVPAAQARSVADPIEGTWSRTGSGAGSSGGTITIRASGAGAFIGTVAVSYNSANGCVHPVGKSVWEIAKSGAGAYTGVNYGFLNGPAEGCAAQAQNATWSVVSPTQLQVCIGSYGCATWTRPAANRAPKVTALRSKGRPGQIARLKFAVSDDGGRTREQIWVKNEANKVIWRFATSLGVRATGRVYWVSFRVPRGLEAGDFCVRAYDTQGKASATSCALLDIY